VRVFRRTLLIALILCGAADAQGQANRRKPQIGYVYPAGGCRGTTFEVLIGGQQLKPATDVYISGEGVSATVVQHFRPVRNLMKDQREELARRLGEVVRKRWAELHEQGLVGPDPPRGLLGRKRPGQKGGKGKKGKKAVEARDPEAEPVELPPHPLWRNLEDKSLRDIVHIRDVFANRGKRQLNAQIAELLLIEVTIDSDAAPGDRELRLVGRAGLTNPMVFQVGAVPEACEQEPNDPNAAGFLPAEPPFDLPVLINGQIMPGDVDRLRFRARQGQRLVIEVHARRLIPFLADAVPGWFQATLTLFDAAGDEVAFADDYGFDPDPVLLYKVPGDGEYEIEIRDSIYRGREDFVYRIAVGEHPFITGMFPLGGREGRETVVSLDGWNLRETQLTLDTRPGAGAIRRTPSDQGEGPSNRVTYAVDTLAECTEVEPNDAAAGAQQIELPLTVNGRIDRPGDVDVFQFEAAAGDEIVAEVLARRLHSPLDALLRLTDASGSVLAWNDDHEYKDEYLHTDMGLLTHHADSYLRVELPSDGTYCVQLTDSQGHGGDAYGYRLRIGPPRLDFTLLATPSGLSMPTGRSAVMAVHVLRRDGFEGPIDIALEDAPAGFSLSGARIPAGRSSIRMTLTAPRKRREGFVTLQLEGRAQVGNTSVRRPIAAAENVMQAFLYRHLVPTESFMVVMTGGRRGARAAELVNQAPVRIPTGGAIEVRFKVQKHPRLHEIELELNAPPPGITLTNVKVVPGGLSFQLHADSANAQVGYADNLIVEAFLEAKPKAETKEKPKGKEKKKANKKRRVSLGFLPAIPYEIVP